ncbi:MAG TPA: hypothetical protein VI298_03525 [Geobacteraceae bacterium]
MIKDFTDSIKIVLHERLTSPMVGIFALTWLGFNWKIPLILIWGEMPMENRVAHVGLHYLSNINNNLYLPLMYSAIIIILYPIVSLIPFYWWSKSSAIKVKIKQKIEGNVLLTIDQSIKLREEYQRLRLYHTKEIEQYTQELENLKNKIETLQGNPAVNNQLTPEDAISYSSGITSAETALSRRDASDVYTSIETLEKLKNKFKYDRTIHIYLGRLYRAKGDYDNAILVLRKFINNLLDIGNENMSPNQIVAMSDAYYNIACYHVLKAFSPNNISNDEASRLKSEAMVELAKSIELNPKNKEFAANDPDFNFLHSSNSPDQLWNSIFNSQA